MNTFHNVLNTRGLEEGRYEHAPRSILVGRSISTILKLGVAIVKSEFYTQGSTERIYSVTLSKPLAQLFEREVTKNTPRQSVIFLSY